MVTNKDRYTRYNANVNITTQINSKLSTTFNTFYKNGLRTGPLSGNWNRLYYQAINFHSALPLGYENLENGEQVPYGTPANMIRYSPIRENHEEVIRFFSKATLEPIDGMQLNLEYTFEKKNLDNNSANYLPTFYNPATLNLEVYQPGQSSFSTATSKRNYHAVNAYGNYGKLVGRHQFDVMLGMNQQTSVSEGFDATRGERISPNTPGLSTSAGVIPVGDFYTDYGIFGVCGRANYQYDDRLLLEVNGRYDGSSRFPKGSRFGFFPSVSGAWKIHREEFMHGVGEILTNLKIRGSWGEIGNQAVEDVWGNYPYLPTMNSGNTNWINNDTGVNAVTLSPPGL